MTAPIAKVATGAAVLAVLLVVGLVAVIGAVVSSLFGSTGAPSDAALADIPAGHLAAYQQAATICPGLDWAILAGIGKVESDHGRSTLPGVTSGENSAGAAGDMQLLQPTFDAILAEHPIPPGGGTPPSRFNLHDAAHAAAFYLCDHGAPADLRGAIWAYNHDDSYVEQVLAHADRYRATPTPRTQWPPEQASLPDPTGTGGRVTPRMNSLYRLLDDAGATSGGATCWDPHPQNPASDHPRGKACDIFFNPHSTTDVARGWETAHWLAATQATTGVRYLIWQGQIWSARAPTWTTYQSRIYGCPNPANLTGCHFDHIHISAY